MKRVLALILAILMVFSLAACGGGKFPSKQITLICPLAAGGGSDAISRLYAAALEKGNNRPQGRSRCI